jgi:hypothetical protein
MTIALQLGPQSIERRDAGGETHDRLQHRAPVGAANEPGHFENEASVVKFSRLGRWASDHLPARHAHCRVRIQIMISFEAWCSTSVSSPGPSSRAL